MRIYQTNGKLLNWSTSYSSKIAEMKPQAVYAAFIRDSKVSLHSLHTW